MGYNTSTHRQRDFSCQMKNVAIRVDMAVCRDGIAATGFATAWPRSRMWPALFRPITSKPRELIRYTTPPVYPCSQAHQGGAIGYTTYVASPAKVRVRKRRMNSRQRSRFRIHSTQATVKIGRASCRERV